MKTLLLNLVAILFAINVYAQPSTISYQGVLTDVGGAVLTGNYAIRFDICTGINGVNSVWNETHNTVSVTNGLFQVELGSITPFGSLNFSTPYWLEITVDPLVTPVTLSPRVAFNASNYSLAGKATSLQIATGAGAGKVLTSDANGNGSWQDASGGVNPSVVGFGTKTVAETRNNTDVLSDDAALFTNWGLGNAGTYLVEFVLAIRIDFLPPANNTGGGIDIAIDKIGAGNVSFSAISSMDAYQIWAQLGDRKNIFCYNCGYNDGTYYSTTIRAIVTIDDNVTGIKLKWAQQSGFAINANSYIGSRSYVYYTKLQ